VIERGERHETRVDDGNTTEARMKSLVRGLALAAVLALSIEAVAQGPPILPPPLAPMQKAIIDLGKDVEAGKDEKAIGKEAERIKQRVGDLGTIVQVFKPRSKGGIGLGPTGEGIEAKLNSIGGKKGISKADLTKFEKELIKTSHVNLAMVEVLRKFPPRPRGGKTVKDWNEYADAMKSGSLDLIKAVKAGDPARVKTVAANISNACNNCHTDFRD
jgi:hypothetical protein